MHVLLTGSTGVHKNLPDHLVPSDISERRNRDMGRIDN